MACACKRTKSTAIKQVVKKSTPDTNKTNIIRRSLIRTGRAGNSRVTY